MSKIQKVLELPTEEFGTIRGYLRELMLKLWSEGESFNGKRPFGNSGWEYDLYRPLVEHGYAKEDDFDTMHKIIKAAIKELCKSETL